MVVRLGELVVILDLHRQGLSVSAIAQRAGLDRKTVRKYVAMGLEPPAYGPRQPRPTKGAAFQTYLRQRVAASDHLARAWARAAKGEGAGSGVARPYRGTGRLVGRGGSVAGPHRGRNHARWSGAYLASFGSTRSPPLSCVDGWLISRLSAFQFAHPSTEARLITSNARLPDVPESFDLAIRGGPDQVPGYLALPPASCCYCSDLPRTPSSGLHRNGLDE